MGIRVLVVDDNPLFAEAVASLLESDARIEVIGCATNGAEAVDFARKLTPDLVLMDIRMPVMDGIEATSRIVSERPHVQVLALTGHGADEEIECALGAGAVGWMAKDDLGTHLIETVIGYVALGSPEVAASFSPLRLP